MMRIDLCSSGLFAEKISAEAVYRLTVSDYGWVSVDAYQRGTHLTECPEGKGHYRLYNRNKRPGRGFDLYFIGAKTIRMELDFPAVNDDVAGFGEMIKMIHGRYKIKQMTDGEGKKQSLEAVLTLLDQLMKKEESNFESYKSFLCSDPSGRKKAAAITMVNYPLYLSIQSAGGMDLAGFKELLHEKQKDYYYMVPMYFQKPGQPDILMAYALTQGAVSIVPKQVFFPVYQPLAADSEILEENIIVNLVLTAGESGEVLGPLPAAGLFAKLYDYVIEDFDEKYHVIRGLTEAEMRALV